MWVAVQSGEAVGCAGGSELPEPLAREGKVSDVFFSPGIPHVMSVSSGHSHICEKSRWNSLHFPPSHLFHLQAALPFGYSHIELKPGSWNCLLFISPTKVT